MQSHACARARAHAHARTWGHVNIRLYPERRALDLAPRHERRRVRPWPVRGRCDKPVAAHLRRWRRLRFNRFAVVRDGLSMCVYTVPCEWVGAVRYVRGHSKAKGKASTDGRMSLRQREPLGRWRAQATYNLVAAGVDHPRRPGRHLCVSRKRIGASQTEEDAQSL